MLYRGYFILNDYRGWYLIFSIKFNITDGVLGFWGFEVLLLDFEIGWGDLWQN